MSTIRISIDPAHDLTAAGRINTEESRESLACAWSEAVDRLADALGISIQTIRSTYESAHEHDFVTRHDTADGETLEQILWQAAHDAVSEESPGVWAAGTPRVSDRLRKMVRALIVTP